MRSSSLIRVMAFSPALLAVVSLAQAKEKEQDISIEISPTTEGPLFEGEFPHYKVRITNNMDRPFRYLARKARPPGSLFFRFTAEDRGEQATTLANSAGTVFCMKSYVRELAPKETREWMTSPLPRADLRAGLRYDVVAEFESHTRDFGLWTGGPIVSNKLVAMVSNAPVTLQVRRPFGAGTPLFPRFSILSLHDGWLTVRQEDPRAGKLYGFRRIAEVGDSEPVLVAEGANGRLHLILENGDRKRTYFHLEPNGEILEREEVDARTTFVKRADGAVVLHRADPLDSGTPVGTGHGGSAEGDVGRPAR